MLDCGVPIHIGLEQLRQINMIVDVDELGWNGEVTVPIARPPPAQLKVHRLSCSAQKP